MRRMILALAAGLLLVACGSDTEAIEERSCEIFRSIATDASDGVDTYAETRDRLKDLLDGYGVSLPADMQGPLRDVVAAMTSLDDASASDAVYALGDACSVRGF